MEINRYNIDEFEALEEFKKRIDEIPYSVESEQWVREAGEWAKSILVKKHQVVYHTFYTALMYEGEMLDATNVRARTKEEALEIAYAEYSTRVYEELNGKPVTRDMIQVSSSC